MKLLKKLLIVLVITILATTIILWVLAKSIKPEVVKNYLSSQLSVLTHQNSKVEGEISWQLFPRPRIKITQIQIGDETNPLHYSMKLENLLFNLKITPLLRGKLVFSELNVDGFKIRLEPEAASILVKNHKTSETHYEFNSNLTEKFAIERLLLSHGQIKIVEKERTISFSGLQIGAEQLNLQNVLFPFQLKGNFEIAEAEKKFLKAQVNFKGSASLSSLVFSNPLTALQNTPLDGQLSLKNIKINEFKIAKIIAHAKTKPGVLLLNPLTFNLYDGESVGDLNYEFDKKKLMFNQTATNIDSAQFIPDLVNKALFKGSLDFSIHAQANLKKENWQETISGNGSVTIKDGIVELINLDKVIELTTDKINKLFVAQKIAKERALELGQVNNPELFKGSSNFKFLSFQYQLKDDKLETNSIVLQTDKLQLKGESQLNLKDYALVSNLFAKVTLADKATDSIQQLLGGSFPILINGTLTEPTVTPDLQKINFLLTKIWLKETLTQPVKKIGKTLQTVLETQQLL
jgi:AsmA protein